MIDTKMEKALNGQVNAEMFSSYLYLSMSAYFDSIGLKGAASWMQAQAQEEMVHAMKIYNYIIERGGQIHLAKIDEPKAEWKSILDAFEDAYKHEQFITKSINDLVDIAHELKDHATNEMLMWFVKEQVEEEASVDEVVQKLKLLKDSSNGLFMVDRDLGTRIPLYTLPLSAK